MYFFYYGENGKCYLRQMISKINYYKVWLYWRNENEIWLSKSAKK